MSLANLRQRLTDFGKDRSGGVILIFTAFILTCSIMVMGLFDLLKVKRAELLLQQITDAAVLIAKRSEASILVAKGINGQTEARTTGEARAKAYVSENLTKHSNLFGTQTQIPTFIWDNVTGDLQMKMKTPLNSLFNKKYFPEPFYTVNVAAKAEMNVGIATEIALVLDNTGSMFENDTRPNAETRFKLLRSATLSFVDNIFDAAMTSNNPDAVRVSVVPWANTVNIKSEAPAVKDYAKYTYTMPTDKGTQTQVATPLSRSVSVNTADFNPVGWRGCIVSNGVESPTTYTDATVSGWGVSYSDPSGGSSFTNQNATNAAGTACTTTKVSGKECATSGWEKNDTCYEKKTFGSGWSKQTCYKIKTNAACTADYNEPTHKVGATGGKWCSWNTKKEWKNEGDGNTPTAAGPNLNCPVPMLGLSSNRKQVIDTVNRMTPTSNTHQDVGLRWGLRTLSPNNGWPTFFGLATDAKPKAFKTDVEKVMILITDGANTGATSGYWEGQSVNLDTMTTGWCSAIRDTYGVKIYTVALNVTDTTAKNLLKSCVGTANPERAFTVDAANLQDALKTIGRSLKSLKLTM